MAEDLIDVRGLDKQKGYAITSRAITNLLEGIDDPVAGMATIASVLHYGFGFIWTGFYRTVTPSLLRVGPYQGTVAQGVYNAASAG